MASKGKRGAAAGTAPPAAVDKSRHPKIQEDWTNREYVDLVVTSMKKLSNFLNVFDQSCRYRLAVLNQKMENLERKLDFVEARIEVKTRSST